MISIDEIDNTPKDDGEGDGLDDGKGSGSGTSVNLANDDSPTEIRTGDETKSDDRQGSDDKKNDGKK